MCRRQFSELKFKGKLAENLKLQKRKFSTRMRSGETEVIWVWKSLQWFVEFWWESLREFSESNGWFDVKVDEKWTRIKARKIHFLGVRWRWSEEYCKNLRLNENRKEFEEFEVVSCSMFFIYFSIFHSFQLKFISQSFEVLHNEII